MEFLVIGTTDDSFVIESFISNKTVFVVDFHMELIFHFTTLSNIINHFTDCDNSCFCLKDNLEAVKNKVHGDI